MSHDFPSRRLGDEVPAFMRQRNSAAPVAANAEEDGEEKEEEETENPLEDLSLDELEYPTFLRRRMQKS